jgi:hypothetical protein
LSSRGEAFQNFVEKMNRSVFKRLCETQRSGHLSAAYIYPSGHEMQNKTSFETSLRTGTTRTRVFAVALLTAAVAVGCGDDGDTGGGTAQPPFGMTGGLATPGFPVAGGTTGGGAAAPGAVAGLAGGPVGGLGGAAGGTVGGPRVDAGVGVPTNPTGGGAAGGGSTDTPWCKVKAILDKNCVACHSAPPMFGAPFALTQYSDVTAASTKVAGKKIYERIAVRVHADKARAENPDQGIMPPGKELSAADLATIDAWVAAGAQQGANATCAGAPGTTGGGGMEQAEVWPLPECDQVYKITSHGAGNAPYSVPPGQEIHPQVSVPAPWGSEKVQAIAFRAVTDNKAVLHHWILNGGGAFLSGWAPGEDGIKRMLPDVGMDMPSGTLRMDMHYNSLTQTTTQMDASGVEVCVVKGAKMRKNHAAVTMGLVGIPIIPGNSTNYETKASCTVGGSQPITLLSASPHAHTHAVRMKFTLQRKSGETIVMHDMPFMFGEQHSYPLDPPVVVQPGDTINTSCFYTNKTSSTVTFGENTGDEMCFNFALYYPAGALSCGGGSPLGGLDIGSIFGGGL